MAELADAADSKSADLRVMGVRPLLPAPSLNSSHSHEHGRCSIMVFLDHHVRVPRAAALTLSSLQGKTVTRKRGETTIRAECRDSALVHATPGAASFRFGGRSASKTTPITRNRITSAKFRWTL